MQGIFLRRKGGSGGGGSGLCAITVTGSGYYLTELCLYLKINGKEITSAGTYELAAGSVIFCTAMYQGAVGKVYLNGTVVATSGSSSGSSVTYSYTVTKNATIKMTTISILGGSSENKIEITEE